MIPLSDLFQQECCGTTCNKSELYSRIRVLEAYIEFLESELFPDEEDE